MGLFGGPSYKAGSIVRFTYSAEQTKDRYKEVLVLNPHWRGKMHGLDLKRMTPAQIQVIQAIFDPEVASGKKRAPFPLVSDILRRMDPNEEIKNPIGFYQKFCKPFLRTAGDCYRTYYSTRMSQVTQVKKSAMEGKQYNPRPLFGKK